MLSQQQQQQQTIVMDAGPLVTDDVREQACNHRAPPRPIITRTVATPLTTPRRSPAAAAAVADDVSSDVTARDNSSESFVTSLAGYSDTLSYEASYLSLAQLSLALCYSSARCRRLPQSVIYCRAVYKSKPHCTFQSTSQCVPLYDLGHSRWKDPLTPPGGSSRMLRGLMLRMGKIFLARADV